MIQTACKNNIQRIIYENIGYSILTLIFSENREKYLGLGESATGLGLMLGPVIGGLVNGYFGYFVTFMVFTVMLVFNLILVIFMLPNKLNIKAVHKPKELKPEDQARLTRAVSTITYSIFIFNRRSIFSFISCSAVCFFISFESSFFTVVLLDHFEINIDYHGYILAIPALAYVVSAILVNYALDIWPRRVFMLMTFIMVSISLFLMGPSETFGFPQYTWLFFLGYTMNGLS